VSSTRFLNNGIYKYSEIFNKIPFSVKIILFSYLPDTLAATTPGGLEHDRVADLGTAVDGLLHAEDTSLRKINIISN
jgi:hypothetical protein